MALAPIPLPAAAPPAFTIHTVAGGDFYGDGLPAVQAQLSGIEGLALSRPGVLYIADPGAHRVRKITPDGIIRTFAGTGVAGFTGDGGPADLARLNTPFAVETDTAGNVFIADFGNRRIRKVTPLGVISTLAVLDSPRGLALGADGALYVAQFDAHRIRALTADGRLIDIAGTGSPDTGSLGGPTSLVGLKYPTAVAGGPGGALYVADSGNHRVLRIHAGRVSLTLGTGQAGWTAVNQLSSPTGLAWDTGGNLLVADSGNLRVQRLSPFGQIRTVAGPGLANPRAVAVDAAGQVYIGDGRRLLAVRQQETRVVAGDGGFGFRGDRGPALQALMLRPSSVAADSGGNLYVADEGNNRIRRVAAEGYITTVLGDGTAATLNSPTSVAVDSLGRLWVAEYLGNRVRRISGSSVEVFQGFTYPSGVAPDGSGGAWVADSGADRVVSTSGATVGGLSGPRGVALDSAGNLYMADTFQHRVLCRTAGGELRVVAGPEAGLRFPRAVAVDAASNVYIADSANHRVRAVTPSGAIRTIAGTGEAGFAGDGGPATAAQLQFPAGLSFDAAGNLYIADLLNNRIRKLIPVPSPPPPRVVNAASLLPGPVAPGELVALFEPGLGPGMQPLFDGIEAAVIAAAPGRIDARVPVEIAGRAVVELEVNRSSQTLEVGLAPGIFPGVLNEDGSLNSASNPSARGALVTFFATGEGQAAPGFISLEIGGYVAEIVEMGERPGAPGVMRIVAAVPAGYAPPGALPVFLHVGTAISQPGVTLHVR